MHKDRNLRIKAYADKVDKSGFDIHLDASSESPSAASLPTDLRLADVKLTNFDFNAISTGCFESPDTDHPQSSDRSTPNYINEIAQSRRVDEHWLSACRSHRCSIFRRDDALLR